jgi:VIT1/CCC1 family predicted Fe2+/Mn2+ transporter
MNDAREPARKRILDPISRVSEILFGLIMALTFTGSLSAATAGQEEVRTMLVGAVGCNIAWGLVDAIMYLVTRLTERGRDLRTFRAVRDASDQEQARRALAEALPPIVAATLPPAELETMRARLQRLPEPQAHGRLDKDDILGSIGVFILVVLSTLPVVIPFLLMSETVAALRVSNAIAVVMLFICGYRLAHYSGNRPWLMGLSMAIVGAVLVGLTIALGG